MTAGPTPALGVCSWSLQARSPRELADRVRETGLDAVQLHLDPLRQDWDPTETADTLQSAGITIASGMMTTEGEDYTTLDSIKRTGGLRPDATWPVNRDAAQADADLAARLGIKLVTLHAGFVPHDPADPERAVMTERVRTAAAVFADRGVGLALETGQETAETLDGWLGELPGVGVNFDPANMILYGMGDPHDALERLGPRVVQLHAKDALPTKTPGEWGEEVRLGTGAVDWPRFFETARRVCPAAAVFIEREAGDSRVADVAAARDVVAPLLAEGAPA